MSPPVGERLAAFANQPVVILGEAMLDSYLHGAAERLSREAPVPIVSVVQRIDAPGGAANTAVNVASLGGRPRLVSVIGDDLEGDRLCEALRSLGVDVSDVLLTPGRTTLAKERVLAADQMLVRVDRGGSDPLTADEEDRLIRRLEGAIDGAAAVIVSDYDYGLVSARVRAALGGALRRRHVPLIVDARDLRRYRNLHPTAVKPNYVEAVRLLGETECRDAKGRALQIGLPAIGCSS